jgi:murein DD-endopeptidase MepM/ murein hydrolase activator NlpD
MGKIGRLPSCTGAQCSERMGRDRIIRGVSVGSGRRWRLRAVQARAALKHDGSKQVGTINPQPTPLRPRRIGLSDPQRLLKHSVLIALVTFNLLSNPIASRSVQPTPVVPTASAEALDQQLSLALAPLPLQTLESEEQSIEILAPQLREPIVPPALFQTPHVLAYGETLGELARNYAISLEALIWANQLEQGDALVEGQILQIPRTSGVLHHIQPGESLAVIAAVYGVTPEAIFGFAPNRLDLYDLAVLPAGVTIFVPGGMRELPEAFLNTYGGLSGIAERGSVPAGMILADDTNMRDGPSTEHQRLFQLEAGRQVALLGRYQDWVFVALGARTGWLRSDLIAAAPADIAGLAEKTDFPAPPPRWVWPARGTITSRFGPRWGGFHNGLDIANRAWTPIVAARSGVVHESGWCRGYGYCVKLHHPGGVETIYGHLVSQPVVGAGERVTAGQLIGHMGSTYDRAGGGYSTGVHLHFTVLIGGRAVDPLKLLP